jgi:hypothetical protein
MDPRIRIRIRTKMSWIRNTAFYNFWLQELAEQLGVIRACSVRLPRLCFTRRPRLPAAKKKKMNRVSDGKGLNVKVMRNDT